MRRLRYSVPYIAGKNLPKDSDPAPRGAGQSCGTGRPNWPNFNPPAPCGAGRMLLEREYEAWIFQSTRPCGAGREVVLCTKMRVPFQSTRPLRGGTGCLGKDVGRRKISIHPPLAGRDSDLAQKNCAKHRILHKKCIYPGRIERFSGFDAAIFLPNVHKFRCEPSEESLLAPRSHAYTIRTPSG